MLEDLVELDLGHVTGTTPVRKGMELDRARLQAYLATVLGSSIFSFTRRDISLKLMCRQYTVPVFLLRFCLHLFILG